MNKQKCLVFLNSVPGQVLIDLCTMLLKLINYSCCYQPTRTAHSDQVDEFRNPMKNELKTTRV